MKIDLKNLDIKKVHDLLINKKLSVRELVDMYLKNINEKNKELNIFLSIFSDIDKQIETAQKKIDEGNGTLLTGVPIAVKANIAIKNENTSGASKILEKYKSPYDATVITKLKNESVVFLGYTNMDEFACGGSTENSAFGVTKNPLDKTRVPGGSSGGSAAAVAADMALVALGTDTGGSVRQPASFCGLVGIKPTHGRVSRHGTIAMGSSLDQICPITKNISDSKIIMNIIAGRDEYDMTAIKRENFLDKKIKKLKKIGVPRSFIDKIDNVEVIENFNRSVEKLKKEGYEMVDINLDIFEMTLPIYYIIMSAELSSNLSRLDGIRYGGSSTNGENLIDDYKKTRGFGFGEEVKRRIILGTYNLSAGYEGEYYNKANALREKIKAKFIRKIEKLDAVIMPTTPEVAFSIGKNIENPMKMYLSDIFTVSSNIIGNPAISIPSGFIRTKNDTKMPLGLQILTNFKDENMMYQVAEDFIR